LHGSGRLQCLTDGRDLRYTALHAARLAGDGEASLVIVTPDRQRPRRVRRLRRRDPFTRGDSISKDERHRVNDEIRAPQVRLIDDEGGQMGVVSLREAINAARERGLDLVEVAPAANPPVCKILDYGKFQYLQMKKQREARKSQKTLEIKEIRIRPKTDDYHIGFKLKNARRFLAEGAKVKVRIQFRGREITHPEIGLEQLREVAEALADVADVEQKPDMEGRTMLMVLAPK
jgi:translation initiation factor IF-3